MGVLTACVGAACAADLAPVYEPATLIAAKAIPGLVLRDAGSASSWAIQFGPGKQDVLHVVSDCQARYTRHDRLYVYHPDLFPEPRLLSGRWRDGVMSFQPVTVSSMFEKSVFDAELEPEVTTDWQHPETTLHLAVRADLRAEKHVSFVLIGKLPGVTGSEKAPPLTVLLARPFLKVTWDRRTDPVSVRGVVHMGEFRFLPDSGIGAKGSLEIVDANGQAIESTPFRPRCSPLTGYFDCGSARRLRPLTPYSARVRLALPPIAEAIEASASTVLPE